MSAGTTVLHLPDVCEVVCWSGPDDTSYEVFVDGDSIEFESRDDLIAFARAVVERLP